jgi:transcriptional regulator with XRE-family HTH domain
MIHANLKSPSEPTIREISDLATQTNGTTATERGMLKLAARVVKIRKERGITQVELAKTLGVTQSMVSRIERGELRLNGEVIVKLAKLYKVSTDELLGVKPISEPTPSVSRRWLKRLTKIEQLPKRDQDGLIQTIDRYLKASDKV